MPHKEAEKSLKLNDHKKVTDSKSVKKAMEEVEEQIGYDLGYSKKEIMKRLTRDKKFSSDVAEEAIKKSKINWNKQALIKAEQLIEHGGISKRELYTNLKTASLYGFTESEAQYAVDHLKVNWNKQALNAAKDSIRNGDDSKEYLRLKLRKYSKFRNSEVQYAMDHLTSEDVNWNQQALKNAKNNLKYGPHSKTNLLEDLSSDSKGFTKEEAQYAVDNLTDVNWGEQALREARSKLKYDTYSKQKLIEELSDESTGYTQEEAQYAVDHLSIDWSEMVVKAAKSYKSYGYDNDELREALVDRDKFTPEQVDAVLNGI
ncbi:hypothetical protein XA3_06620 [Xylocopilactobacillus apicola]|uniref:Putative host cell surface-exposed lipoprotein Ltp-like HTH region domain-containing protein n=1 Tax=Xylocopilactobacillus apicola TaxID=2932184 RepID=A0AAU9D0K8_9LACO|nr:hypothetical protein XA3_06620 [Xylocopilactobacillus apicola]